MIAALALLAACSPQAKVDVHARVAQARGMALESPSSPAQHYFLQGRVAFRTEGVGEYVQKCELLLAGPAHMKYVLRAGVMTQIFLVESPEKVWLRKPRTESYAAYDAGALPKECWARWTLARFPWGWKEALPGAKTQLYKGGERDLSLPSPYGECVLTLGKDFLPLQLKLGTLQLNVSGNAARAGRPWFPAVWTWTHNGNRWEETWEQVDDAVLAFDETFAPPETGVPRGQWRVDVVRDLGAAVPAAAEDQLGLLQLPAERFLVGPWPAEWAAPLIAAGTLEAATWRLLGPAEPQAALALRADPPAPLPPGVSVLAQPAGLFLRWATFRVSEPQAGAALLQEAAQQGKLKPLGPVMALLSSTGERGRSEWLLPVEPPAAH